MVKHSATRIINEVKKHYNTIAKEWDISRAVPSGIKMKLLREVEPKDKVLDLGCGNGFIVPLILEVNAKYFGLDISSALVKIAKKNNAAAVKAKLAEFVVGDATTRLPYRTGTFNRLFSFAVLHHVPSEEKRLAFLSEVKRVLKPGGTAGIIVWNILNDWPKNRFKIDEQSNPDHDYTVPWKATSGQTINRYIHCFDDKELKRLCKQVGFSKIQLGYYSRAGKKEKNGEELVLQLTK